LCCGFLRCSLMSELKTCSKCKKEQTTDQFYKRPDTYRGRPGTLRGWCRKCECASAIGIKKRSKISNPSKYLWSTAKIRANKNNIPFSIEPEDVIIPEVCPVLGTQLELNNGYKNRDSSPSLDRIVPSSGYVPGNIIVVSWRVNRMKSDATPEELRKIADFYNHQHINS
jgi:hypothetical protein